MNTDLNAATRLPADDLAALRHDALRGLTTTPKSLPPKWLYDPAGSALFDEITRLCPEYYPTRTERAILTRVCAEIAAASGAQSLIELGSGSSNKTRLLISALRDHGTLRRYLPVDVSASALDDAVLTLAAAYPGLEIQPAVADFTTLPSLPPTPGPRLVAFLGGTYGNLLPAERSTFLTRIGSRLAPSDTLLLGVDLVKDPATLVRAYDDAAGVTARFNLNVLARLNRELGADFDLDSFDHTAIWDPGHEWIEMRLRSRRDQAVTFHGLDGLIVHFDAGEDLRTEVSAKFRPTGLARELSAAGLDLTRWWTDPHQAYGLALAAPTDHPAAVTPQPPAAVDAGRR